LYQTTSTHQLLLFVGTKSRIAMVGRQIILAMDEICCAVRHSSSTPGAVRHDKAGGRFFDGPWRREAAAQACESPAEQTNKQKGRLSAALPNFC
jgi:hypothetical protein